MNELSCLTFSNDPQSTCLRRKLHRDRAQQTGLIAPLIAALQKVSKLFLVKRGHHFFGYLMFRLLFQKQLPTSCYFTSGLFTLSQTLKNVLKWSRTIISLCLWLFAVCVLTAGDEQCKTTPHRPAPITGTNGQRERGRDGRRGEGGRVTWCHRLSSNFPSSCVTLAE